MDTGDSRGCDGMLRTRGWADFLRWLWGTCSLSAGTMTLDGMRIGARRHRGCARAKLCCARMHEPSSLPQPLIQPRGGSVHCTCPARVGNEFRLTRPLHPAAVLADTPSNTGGITMLTKGSRSHSYCSAMPSAQAEARQQATCTWDHST